MSRLTRDGIAESVSRDQILRCKREQKIFILPVQLTTSRIGNLIRLIHTLLSVRTIHTRTSLCCLSYAYMRRDGRPKTRKLTRYTPPFCVCFPPSNNWSPTILPHVFFGHELFTFLKLFFRFFVCHKEWQNCQSISFSNYCTTTTYRDTGSNCFTHLPNILRMGTIPILRPIFTLDLCTRFFHERFMTVTLSLLQELYYTDYLLLLPFL